MTKPLNKTLKFTPQLSELIKQGHKTTTWRLFDDKNLTVNDELTLATREGETVTNFGRAKILAISIRTISTLLPEDYIGHEPVSNPLLEHKKYYGNRVQLNTEVKVIKFMVIEIYK